MHPRSLESKHDHVWAMGTALLLHGVLLGSFWWHRSGPNSGDESGNESDALVVQYIEINRSPIRHATKAHQSKPRDEVIPTSPEGPIVDPQQTSLDTHASDLKSEQNVSAQSTAARTVISIGYADPSPSTRASPAASNTLGMAVISDNLQERYISAIKQAVKVHWVPREGGLIGSCTLRIQQMAGGLVRSISSSECTLDGQARRSLEAAPLMAQPLPYAGFEGVFQEQISIEFSTPVDEY